MRMLLMQYASGTFVMEHRYSNLETLSQLGELSAEVATLLSGRQQTAYRRAALHRSLAVLQPSRGAADATPAAWLQTYVI